MQCVMEVAKAKIAEMTRQNHRQRFREEADARLALPVLAAEAAIWSGAGGMVGAIAGAAVWATLSLSPVGLITFVVMGAAIGAVGSVGKAKYDVYCMLSDMRKHRDLAIQRIYNTNQSIVIKQITTLRAGHNFTGGLCFNISLPEESDFRYDISLRAIRVLDVEGGAEERDAPKSIPVVCLDEKIEELIEALHIWKGRQGKEQLPFEFVDLSYTALTWEDLHALLAAGIGNCHAETLILKGNDLSGKDPHVNILNLLSAAICEGGAFPCLKHLDVSRSRLEGSQLVFIQNIARHRTLETLILSHNPLLGYLDWIDRIIFFNEPYHSQKREPLCPFLEELPRHMLTLKSLGLSNVGFQTQRQVFIATTAISRLPYLKQIDLSHNHPLQSIIASLLSRPGARPFALEKIKIEGEQAHWVGKFLVENDLACKQLKQLFSDWKQAARERWGKLREAINETDLLLLIDILSQEGIFFREEISSLASLRLEAERVRDSYDALMQQLESVEEERVSILLTLLNIKFLQRKHFTDAQMTSTGDIAGKISRALELFYFDDPCIQRFLDDILALRKTATTENAQRGFLLPQDQQRSFLKGSITESEWIAFLKQRSVPFYRTLLLQGAPAPVVQRGEPAPVIHRHGSRRGGEVPLPMPRDETHRHHHALATP